MFECTDEIDLLNDTSVIIVDDNSYEITEHTKTYQMYEFETLKLLKKFQMRRLLFSKKGVRRIGKIKKHDIEFSIAISYMVDVAAGQHYLIEYPVHLIEKYKLAFHQRLVHTFRWNPDAERLLNLFQKYFPVVDFQLLEQLKISQKEPQPKLQNIQFEFVNDDGKSPEVIKVSGKEADSNG